MSFLHTTRFSRGKLPHWEVEHGRYFVTTRLADALPRNIVLRLQEIHLSLSALPANSPAFLALQRQYFQMMEKYLDAEAGTCLLRDPHCANIVVEELRSVADWTIEVPHYSIMPNHWHALIIPRPGCVHGLAAVMKRVKGRTAKRINQRLGRTDPVWQREWFDRWMRDDAELGKTVTYIQQNPVKACLVSAFHEHRWTK